MLVQWVQNPQEAYESGDKYIRECGRPLCWHLRMDDRSSGFKGGSRRHYGLRNCSLQKTGVLLLMSSADCPTIDYNKVDESDSENAIWYPHTVYSFHNYCDLVLQVSSVL